MVKPEKHDHLQLVYHFTIPLNNWTYSPSCIFIVHIYNFPQYNRAHIFLTQGVLSSDVWAWSTKKCDITIKTCSK